MISIRVKPRARRRGLPWTMALARADLREFREWVMMIGITCCRCVWGRDAE
jgi:hypothetical protein